MDILSTKRAKDDPLNFFFQNNPDYTSTVLINFSTTYNLLDGAIMNDAINMHAQGFFECTCFQFSLIYIFRCEITRSYGNPMFNRLK